MAMEGLIPPKRNLVELLEKVFPVDGELRSRTVTTALAFSFPRRVGLDMRHRPPTF